jgi:hypothetical protein
MGGVVAARIEWLDLPAEWLEVLVTGAVDVALVPGLSGTRGSAPCPRRAVLISSSARFQLSAMLWPSLAHL